MPGQAYSYIRFSSDKQEVGDSLRRQLDKAEAYAARHKLVLDHSTYRDLGVSAFRGKNATEGALAAFLEAVDAGQIPKGSSLIVENFDRMSRLPVMEALALFQSIVARGITIITLTDEQVYNTETLNENWTKLIIALAQMSRANEENKRKAENVQQAWDNKRKEAEAGTGHLTSVCPAWLRLDGVKRKTKRKPWEEKDEAEGPERQWVVIKEKADVVKRIFALASEGHGSPTIARRLNEDKVPTLGGIAYEWSPGLVAATLKNRAVIGTFTPKKAPNADPIEGYYPAIISSEQFFQVQQHIAGRNQRGGIKGDGVANLFAGMTYCECGRRTRFVSGSKPHLYLRCLSAYANTGCDAPTYPYNLLEAMLADYFVHAGKTIQGTTVGTPDTTLTARGELVEKRTRYDRLLDLAEIGSPGIGQRIVKLEREIAELQHQITNAVPARPIQDAAVEVWNFLDEHERLKADGGDALRDHRLKLQAAIRQILTKLVLRKATHKAPAANGGFEYREIVLYGPVADALADEIRPKHQWIVDNPKLARYTPLKAKIERVTDDGGVVQMLELPPSGFQPGNIRGRRTKK